jgi:CRISPR/Cas system-associated protein Cas10 (large subunit of type III CRISPR-Cas system)
MSKSHRGFGVRELVKSGRGTCPVCKRTGIKTLYEYEKDEKTFMICKQCKVAIARGKQVDGVAAL